MVQTALDVATTREPTDTVSPVKKRGFIRIFVARNKLGTFGFVMLAFILLLCFIGPFIVPEAGLTDVKNIYGQPEWGHPLGFDHSGRDIWARRSTCPICAL